jgi:uncharacterized protein
MVAQEEKTYGMLAHLLAFSGFFIPFGNIIGPLVIWLMKKDESPFVDHHGKESLNFQISIMIYLVISIILCFVLIGFFLLAALGIFELVMIIIAAVKANNGEAYAYPLSIRIIR